MKKILFIDRDGTLIKEPPITFQIDKIADFELLPGVIKYLGKLVEETDFELVMVSNQDGLGTAAYPLAAFDTIQQLLLKILGNEGIHFKEICIDNSTELNPSTHRKPSIGMVKHYINEGYDLKNSWVIGDRLTDGIFAENIGCQSVLIGIENAPFTTETAKDWSEIYAIIKGNHRTAQTIRNTQETQISCSISLDSRNSSNIQSPLKFLNHMLEQIAKHGQLKMEFIANGDIDIDDHHLVEDTALVLGETIKKALGNKKGIARYGFVLPMDESLAQVAIDFGGRPWLNFACTFRREKIGDIHSEMFFHFFKSFSDAAQCNIHIACEGENDHHKIEAIFKAFAKCIAQAKEEVGQYQIPSSKGIL